MALIMRNLGGHKYEWTRYLALDLGGMSRACVAACLVWYRSHTVYIHTLATESTHVKYVLGLSYLRRYTVFLLFMRSPYTLYVYLHSIINRSAFSSLHLHVLSIFVKMRR